MHAALTLSQEKGFPSLSLREVTREAGVAPATFYRYFVDMEDLGLALVDEVGLTLRRLMRQARRKIRGGGSVVQTSVETFMLFLDESPQLFQLLMGDQAGGPRSFREALRRERHRFIDELVDDLNQGEAIRNMPLAHVELIAEMMVNLVFMGGVEAIDMNREQRKQLSSKLEMELRLIFAGSSAWAQQQHAKAEHATSGDV
ncbi:MAG: HTH-type transcriptional repressor FabR [Pseudomonadales bacterium]|nr:HTH-type transcriptional repressor FabR [Pseudomonadales bacterium]